MLAGSALCEPSLHHESDVLCAVNASWNSEHDKAVGILKPKCMTDPRYALEYGFVHVVRDAIKADTCAKEALYDMFVRSEKLGERLASHYHGVEHVDPLDDDESDDITEDLASTPPKSEPSFFSRVASSISRTFGDDIPSDPKELCTKIQGDTIAADSLLMRSIIQLQNNHYVSGALNIRKTWGRYQALMKILDHRSDDIPKHLADIIKCGVGVFYIFLTLMPPALLKVLEALGFVANRELGERYLQETFASGGVRSPVAALNLLTLYLFCPTGLTPAADTLASAGAILKVMNDKFPNNSYFFGYANFYRRKMGDGAGAAECINKAMRGFAAGKAPLLLRYIKADTYFMDMQWGEAARLYAALWEDIQKQGTRSFDYSGQVMLTLGASHAMLGDLASARACMARVAKVTNPDSKQDLSSPPFAKLCCANPAYLQLAGLFCLHLNRDLHTLCPAALQSLSAQLQRVSDKSSGVRNMRRLYEGILQRGLGNLTAACASLEAVTKQGKIREGQDTCGVAAHAYYELGEIAYQQGDRRLAKHYLRAGNKLKHSDKTDALSSKYSNALADLEKGA